MKKSMCKFKKVSRTVAPNENAWMSILVKRDVKMRKYGMLIFKCSDQT